MPASAALTLAQLADQIDRHRQTHPGSETQPVVIGYDPGHTTMGGQPKMAIVGLSGGIDWDHGTVFLHTAQPVGAVPEVLRQKLRRYENLVGHLHLHLRRSEQKGQAPDPEAIRTLIQHLQDGAFESQQPHWDTEAVLNEQQMAKALAIQVPAVRKRLKAGQLIAWADPLTRERSFPAYQAWAAVANRPLVRLLAELSPSDSGIDIAAHVHAWLTKGQDRLEGLQPLEVLVGERITLANQNRQALLDLPHRDRVEAVIAAAQASDGPFPE